MPNFSVDSYKNRDSKCASCCLVKISHEKSVSFLLLFINAKNEAENVNKQTRSHLKVTSENFNKLSV
jgi:hypothetical protein